MESSKRITKDKIKTKKTDHQEVKKLLARYNRFFSDYKSIKKLKEPVVLLIRRNRDIQIYEGIKDYRFEYKHTDGTERFILINNRNENSLKYGNDSIRTIICHEDYPTPLPQNPIMTVEEMGGAIEKTLNDASEWKAKKEKYAGDKIMKFFIGMAVVIGAIAVGYMLIKGNQAPQVQQVVQQVPQAIQVINETIQRNVTIISPTIL